MFKTPKPSGATTSDPDKDVLNNLAIALQLLIVSNLMKAPNNELETGKEISFAKLLDLIPLPSPAHVPTTPLKSLHLRQAQDLQYRSRPLDYCLLLIMHNQM
ncbi:hypothetical protein EVAR_100976_1 [Eumeta japonica]|uniref:Uncharacterized protein n=1 Tax=Eumeta variegata TaxID=151549 RepID=A0A4C2A472_EUMVA|nr:hypothetical protein EVAR_100976_1 [Eumeta japonica]